MSKYSHIDFKPTESMAKAAKRGLEMRDKQPSSNKGMTSVGLARANQLIARETLSPDTVKRMYSFFSRHEVDKSSKSWREGNSKGEQAWLGWGGDAGFSWSRKIVNQMQSADKKGKNNMRLNFTSQLMTNADKVSTQKINGVDHLIVKDVCHMIGDSVMNGIFYPMDEMEKLAANLQNRRIIMPAEHPVDRDGAHMSATDPLSHIDHLVGAFAYNFSIRNDKLISDMAINPSVAFNHPQGETIINAIKRNTDLDMSTGFYLDIEEIAEFKFAPDGNEYNQIARNLSMDHSALLPISPGAKQSNEGVGIHANAALDVRGNKMDLSTFVANDVAASMSLPMANRETPFSEDNAVSRIKGFTSSGNMPSTNYRKFFAYYDRERSDNFDGYMFPIADIIDGKPMVNYIALVTAEKQILEAQISEDEKDKARTVIGHYMAKFDEQGSGSMNNNLDEGILRKAINAALGVFGFDSGYNSNSNSDGVAVVNQSEGNAKMKNRMMKKLKENGYKQEEMDNMSDDEMMNAYDSMMKKNMGKKENAEDDMDDKEEDKKKMKGNSAELATLVANAVAEAQKPLLDKIQNLETANNANEAAKKSGYVDMVVNSVKGMTKEVAEAMPLEALETLAAANGHTNFNVGSTGTPVHNNSNDDGYGDMSMPTLEQTK
ncbi:coil containing protein [Vibrio phage 1.214.O._10N.222.54.F11]|nr:coil containing protein [Vibrio phage 1.214.O._10N.222.54.F11]